MLKWTTHALQKNRKRRWVLEYSLDRRNLLRLWVKTYILRCSNSSPNLWTRKLWRLSIQKDVYYGFGTLSLLRVKAEESANEQRSLENMVQWQRIDESTQWTTKAHDRLKNGGIVNNNIRVPNRSRSNEVDGWWKSKGREEFVTIPCRLPLRRCFMWEKESDDRR